MVMPLRADRHDRLDEVRGSRDGDLVVVVDQGAMAGIGSLEIARLFGQPPRGRTLDHLGVDPVGLGDASDPAPEDEPAILQRFAGPAARLLGRQRIEAAGNVMRDLVGLIAVGEELRRQRTQDRGLLDDRTVTDMGDQRLHQVARLDRLADEGGEIAAGDLAAVVKRQDAVLDCGVDEELVQRGVVLEVDLRLAALDLVERRLGDVEVAEDLVRCCFPRRSRRSPPFAPSSPFAAPPAATLAAPPCSISAPMWRWKKVSSSVRIWAPSTSASVMMMIL